MQWTVRRAFNVVMDLVAFTSADDHPTILLDFEKAAFNAWAECVGDYNLGGCFFHFKQCLHKRVQELGLQAKYCTNVDFRIRVSSLGALAFLPVHQVHGPASTRLTFFLGGR